jgi:hypothetical protein
MKEESIFEPRDVYAKGCRHGFNGNLSECLHRYQAIDVVSLFYPQLLSPCVVQGYGGFFLMQDTPLVAVSQTVTGTPV